MFIKYAKMKIESSSVIDRDMLLFTHKKAFIKHDISDELIHASNGLDIVSELKERDPQEWVIFRARAIDAGGSEKTGEVFHGANDNGDFFSEEELLKEAEGSSGLKSFETFINCSLFTNHQNDDVEKSRGKVVNAFYDKKNHCVYTDVMVDAKAYPELARGIREGYINDVSMGCSVQWSECSVCNNKAVKEEDYCSHVKNHKGKKIAGQSVYEKNHGIKFIELSAVTDGACENCTIQNVYTGPELLNKLQQSLSGHVTSFNKGVSIIRTAGLEENSYRTLVKETLGFLFDSKQIIKECKTAIKKEARGEDVDKLNQALDFLREVADQILSSKAVDFEFLENIGSLLADLQKLIVDLVEAGFANEGGEAPQQEGAPAEGGQAAPPPPAPEPQAAGGGGAAPAPAQPAPAAGAAAPPPMPMSQTQMAGSSSVKNIRTSQKYSSYLEGLSEINLKLNDIIEGIGVIKQEAGGKMDMPTKRDLNRKITSSSLSEKFAELIDERVEKNEPVTINHGPYSVTIDQNRGISGYVNSKNVIQASKDDVGEEAMLAAKISPEVVAGRLIEVISSRFNEDGEKKMGSSSKNIKEALISELKGSEVATPPVDQVQEGQLEDLPGNWSRKNDTHEATGQVGELQEGQLENVPKSKETGKGDWNRKRPDDHKEDLPVTEGQLRDGKDYTKLPSERKVQEAATAEGQLGEVQEGQFQNYTDTSGQGDDESAGRWHDNATPGDALPLTEKQFKGKDRLGWGVDELQEGQLDGHRWGPDKTVSSDASPHRASKEERIVTAILNGFANVALANRISPKSIVKSEAGLKFASSSSQPKVGGKWTSEGIRKVAQQAILIELDEAFSGEDYNGEDVADAISALYEDPQSLEVAIDNTFSDKVQELNNIDENVTVEEDRKASYINVLRKAALRKQASLIHLSPENLIQLLGNGFSLNKLKDTDLEAALQQLNPGAQFYDFSRAADGGWNLHSTVKAEDLVLKEQDEISGHQEVPQAGFEMGVEDPADAAAPNVPAEVEPQAPAMATAGTAEKMDRVAQMAPGRTENGIPASMPNAEPPAAGADGVESLTAPDVPEGDFGDEGLGSDIEEIDDTDGEPQPPGSICPLCGDNDVNVVEGKMHCNNCGGEAQIEVNWKMLNLPDNYDMTINQKQSGEDEEEIGGEESTEGENINDELNAPAEGGLAAPPAPGGEGGGGGAPGGMPMGAHSGNWLRISMNINPVSLATLKPLKFASKSKVSAPGQRCPSCGSSRVAFANSKGSCTRCGTDYAVSFAKKKGNLIANIDYSPNIKLAEDRKIVKIQEDDGTIRDIDLGRAVKGEFEADAEAVKKELHKILSSRKTMLKMSSDAEASGNADEMMVCTLDQCGKGYSTEDASNICSAMRDTVLGIKTAQFEDDDDDDEIEEVETEDKGEDDFSPEENDSEEDSVEFEDDLIEITDQEEDVNDIPGEDGETINTPKVQKIELYMEDADGTEFEVEFDVSGLEPETIEEPADFDEAADEEPAAGEEIIIEEIVEDTPEEIEEIDEMEDNDMEMGMGKLFMDDSILEPQEEFEQPMEMDERQIKELSAETSEFLRGNRVASSNRNGGSALDFEKLAQAMGVSMPTDTQADVPRNEGQGIREDGIPASTSDHPNTAKEMKDGKHRAEAYTDPDQAIDRGVEVIKPRETKVQDGEPVKASGKIRIKKHAYDSIEPESPGSDMNHAVGADGSDGSAETPTSHKEKNNNADVEMPDYGKGKAKKAEDNNQNPEPAGSAKNHAVASTKTAKVQKCAKCDCDPCECKGGKATDKEAKKVKKMYMGDGMDTSEMGGEVPMGEQMTMKPKKKMKMKMPMCSEADQDGWFRTAQSQTATQEEPVDALQDDKKLPMSADSEDSLDVPRDESKAKPETDFPRPKGVDKPVEVRQKEYGFGNTGKDLHTEVVPRDGSGDGVGGESVNFADDKAVDMSSGSPDTYVQDFQDNVDPTPVGNEDNHGATGVNSAAGELDLLKTAIDKVAETTKIEANNLDATDLGDDTILVAEIIGERIFKIAKTTLKKK